MRLLSIPVLTLGVLTSFAVVAQTSSPGTKTDAKTAPAPSSQGSSQTSPHAEKSPITAQKLKQDLEKAGFADVSVVAGSFVVQAKTKDGDPVLMTIGPRGLTVFQANASSPATTGSTSGPSGATSSGSSASGTKQ